MSSADFDIDFDLRSDTPPGKDPDSLSPTLRRYHQRLWSKRLPSGQMFLLSTTVPGAYLHHESDLGEFVLRSDGAIPAFTNRRGFAKITSALTEEETTDFARHCYTIGGRTVWPGRCIGGKNTINRARGLNRDIGDRFDLTIECVRRHYRGEPSPLADDLLRYARFFDLFGDFRGYTEFFLLQDLVSEDASAVRFFMPFDDFADSPIPSSVEAFREYRARAREFISARAQRMSAYVNE